MNPRSSVLEMIEAAEEQGYRTVDKGGGSWMVYAPKGRSVPGYETVAIHMPRSEGGGLQTIRANLRRAGVRFPEDIARERARSIQPTRMPTTTQQIMTSATNPAPERDPIDELLAICNRQAELAAEAAGVLERIRKHVKDKAAQADQVLAAFDLLAKAREGR